MILALLTKIIAFHMQMALVIVRVLGLGRSIKIVDEVHLHLVLSLFNADLDKVPKENIGESKLRSRGWRSRLNAWRYRVYKTRSRASSGKFSMTGRKHYDDREIK